MQKKRSTSLIFIVAIMIFTACNSTGNRDQKSGKMTEADKKLMETAKRFFGQMPAPADPNTPVARLGKKLYYEKKLSANGQMSCNTCHPIDTYGVDNLPVSPGHDGTPGTRNSPTTFNAWFHTTQFWDGRSPNLAEQAKLPVLNADEMGLKNGDQVVEILKNDPVYPGMFKAAFPDQENPITFDNFALAIAGFEETLATPAAFDDFMNGASAMLDSDQKEGLTLFMETGCIACHIGPGLGGNIMQRFGVVHGPYWDYTGSKLRDKGKEEVTKNPADSLIFKSPSLRNIEKTGPYFHDGSVASLKEAVKIMAFTQLGRELTDAQADKMVGFFKTLTGRIPQHALPGE